MKSFHSPTTHFNPPSSRISPPVIHSPTTSLNSPLFHPNTSSPSGHFITKICKSLHSHCCYASLEQTPTSTTTNNYLIHRTNSPKPHLLLSLHRPFTEN